MSARPWAESRQLSAVAIRLGFELVHDAARLLQREGDEPLGLVPVLLVDLRVLLLERVQPILLLEGDLELGDVQFSRVAEALEEEAIHDLGDRLTAAADPAVGRDVEDDGMSRDVLLDVLERAPCSCRLRAAALGALRLLALRSSGSRARGRGTWRSSTSRSRRSRRPTHRFPRAACSASPRSARGSCGSASGSSRSRCTRRARRG